MRLTPIALTVAIAFGDRGERRPQGQKPDDQIDARSVALDRPAQHA